MIAFYKKYARTAFDLALVVLTIFLIMSSFSYLFSIATPIFIALLIYFMVAPTANFLHRKGMKKSIATNIAMIVFILLVLGVIFVAGLVITNQILSLSATIPKYIHLLQGEIVKNADYFQSKINALPPEVLEKAKEYVGLIAQKSSAYLSAALVGTVGAITSFSTMFFNFVVGIILAYFLSLEIGDWKRIAAEKTPRTFKNAFIFLKENVLNGIGKYVKAQLLLICISFMIIFLGLLFAGVDNALTIALLAALLDILPLLGMPVIFIPWAVYLLIVGQTGFGLYLLGLLAFSMIFRQIAEPKIAGDSLGVSAFTMFSFMIISLSIFGVAGIIASPILIILIKALYEKGIMKKLVRMPQDEFDEEEKKTELV
ncbi:UNVERIFIED_CONTAM: sporulation integral membrane protein YtvI [Brevibacillus sp. OAP136]